MASLTIIPYNPGRVKSPNKSSRVNRVFNGSNNYDKEPHSKLDFSLADIRKTPATVAAGEVGHLATNGKDADDGFIYGQIEDQPSSQQSS